jgi:hypothetical protein
MPLRDMRIACRHVEHAFGVGRRTLTCERAVISCAQRHGWHRYLTRTRKAWHAISESVDCSG